MLMCFRRVSKETCRSFLVHLLLFSFLPSNAQGFAIEPGDGNVIEWQSTAPWTEGRFPYEGQAVSIPYSTQNQKGLLLGNLKASAGCFYPQFDEKNEFIKRVNKFVLQHAKTIFCEWILKTSDEEIASEELDQEAIDLAFDHREFRFKLTPAYASSHLISLFGETNRFSGIPHGSSRYLSLNFFWDGRKVTQVALGQMVHFSEEFSAFLSSYCTRFLKKNQIGYFSDIDNFSSTIRIQLDDCDVVTLSESGLTITFQPYKVGGWADGPYSVKVPFEELSNFIIADGPISYLINGL